MRFGVRLGFGAVGLMALAAAALAQPQRPCPSCDRRLQLNEAEWRCLESQFGYFIGRPIEPFRIAAVGCDPGDRGDRQPDTRVKVTKEKAPRRKPVTLSRQQLICLRDHIDRIERRGQSIWSGPQPVDLVRLCGPPTLGTAR